MSDETHRQLVKLAKQLGCEPTGSAVLKASLKLAKETLKANKKADRKAERKARVAGITVEHAEEPVRLMADAAVEAVEKDLIDTLAEAGFSPTGRSVFGKPVFADFTDAEKRAAAHIVGCDFEELEEDIYKRVAAALDRDGDTDQAHALNQAETGGAAPRKLGHYVHLIGQELYEKACRKMTFPDGIQAAPWAALSPAIKEQWFKKAQYTTLYGKPEDDTAGWVPLYLFMPDGKMLTNDPAMLLEAVEKQNEDLAHQVETLRAQVEHLESLRPHWAKGFSSDSIAAQGQTTALNQLWALLGVKDQTAAVDALKKLTAKPLPDLAFLRSVEAKGEEGVVINRMVEHHRESWEAALRLSDAGMLAIEQRANGGRLHLTHLGRKRLMDSEV